MRVNVTDENEGMERCAAVTEMGGRDVLQYIARIRTGTVGQNNPLGPICILMVGINLHVGIHSTASCLPLSYQPGTARCAMSGLLADSQVKYVDWRVHVSEER